MVLQGVHDTGEAALEVTTLIQADVMLIDVHLTGISGLECVILLKRQHPAVQFILFTAREEAQQLFQCLRAGACGYLLSSLGPQALLAGIRSLHAGGTPMSAAMTRQMAGFIQRSVPEGAAVEGLSPRERQVLVWLAQGMRQKEIAEQLGVGHTTVRTFLERAYAKLGATNRSEAVARFIQHRL
jgi:DNA-binding NarL/FixJ family response regulator